MADRVSMRAEVKVPSMLIRRVAYLQQLAPSPPAQGYGVHVRFEQVKTRTLVSITTSTDTVAVLHRWFLAPPSIVTPPETPALTVAEPKSWGTVISKVLLGASPTKPLPFGITSDGSVRVGVTSIERYHHSQPRNVVQLIAKTQEAAQMDRFRRSRVTVDGEVLFNVARAAGLLHAVVRDTSQFTLSLVSMPSGPSRGTRLLVSDSRLIDGITARVDVVALVAPGVTPT